MSVIGFNLLNPFSMFKRITVVGATFGSLISFYFNMKDELGDIARKDDGVLGE